MILEVTNAYSGYCHQCDEPGNVGELVLKKAGNRFNLCESCINEIRKQVASQTLYAPPVSRENAKDEAGTVRIYGPKDGKPF